MASDEGAFTCVGVEAIIELSNILVVSLIISSNDSTEKVTDNTNSDKGKTLNALKSNRSTSGLSSISLIENPSMPIKFEISISSNTLDSIVLIF